MPYTINREQVASTFAYRTRHAPYGGLSKSFNQPNFASLTALCNVNVWVDVGNNGCAPL